MKISPQWIRDFVDVKADDRQLAEDLTMAGMAVEGFGHDGQGNTIYEMEITTNRPDAMNHYGLARECAAIYDVELKPLLVKLPAMAMAARAGPDFDPRPDSQKKPQPFVIDIEDGHGCARYTARMVRGVTITASPEHMARRLESVDQRPINNAADASNYTLWEMGHPTHAFDLDLLEGGKIIVRRAREGETLKTLDGVERKLFRDDLVIADARKPVALAGVMGGDDTKVTEKTKTILIESAWFDPVVIRKTAKRHGLHTDASHRFERGADWGATPLACARVAQLIIESAGGRLEGAEIDAVARRIERAPVQLLRSEVLRILGKDLSEDEIARILRRLGFGVTPGRATKPVKRESAAPSGVGGAHAAVAEEAPEFTVNAPTWRLDVEREIDVIEEVARIHGYNQFPNTLPEFAGAVIELPEADKDERLRTALLALGYNEAMSVTFIGRDDAQAFSSAAPVEIANPISEEAAFMRNSMLPGMLAMLGWNLNRGNNDVRLFEAGNIYERVGERTEERKRIALGATGNAVPSSWEQKGRPYTFFDMKGGVETLLGAFAHRTLYFDALAGEHYHPGRSARAVMDGATVARFGQLHPEVAATRKLKQDVFVGELFLDRLYPHALREPRYAAIARYPAVDRDFSFLFDNTATFERIKSAVDALRLAELRRFTPVEVFRGGAIPAGKYSVLLRAIFQSAERTLRDDEVALWAQQIIKALETLGGTLRA